MLTDALDRCRNGLAMRENALATNETTMMKDLAAVLLHAQLTREMY
jgi:hypothetical protein